MRVAELRQELTVLLRASDPDFVFFLETRGRGLFLRAAPIDVSRIVRDEVVDHFKATVLTSATLAVDGGFDYVRGRLGIRHAEEARLLSEFDYSQQAILYLPRRMPLPRDPGFAEAAGRECLEILRRTQGRGFVLFTSYAMLRAVEPQLRLGLRYPILVQGTAPRGALLDQFRQTPNAVLLATSSFWQGVDVVGDQLSCVIIDKLPFASPGDPVTAARMEAMTAEGADPFGDYQVPLAILALLQGLGRLIRHRSDRGVLAILDPRIKSMGYGRRFLASLPPAPVVNDLDAIERFFARPKSEVCSPEPVSPSISPALHVRALGRRHQHPLHRPRQHHLRIPQSRVRVRTRVVPVPAMLGAVAVADDGVGWRRGRLQELLDLVHGVVQVVVVHVADIDAQLAAQLGAQRLPIASKDVGQVEVLAPVARRPPCRSAR